MPLTAPLPHDDDELIAAAMAYLTIAVMQGVRPDAHLVIDGAPVVNTMFWPAGWQWHPAATAQENLLRARNLIDIQLAEPGQPAPTHGYPRQSDVAEWHEATNPSLQGRTLDLLREVGALRAALLGRQQDQRGSFTEWTTKIRNALGDVFINLLDLADAAGFDLESVTARRWQEVTTSTPKKAP